MPTGYSKNIPTGALGVVGGLLSVVGCREKSEWDLESVCSANVTPDGSKVAKILLESGLCADKSCKVSGIRSTPREPGRVSRITSLCLSLLICKPELITAPHKAGVRTTFSNVCKGLGRCLEPNKWPLFVR